MKVRLPVGWEVVRSEGKSGDGGLIDIPRGNSDDLELVLTVSGVTAVLGMIAIALSLVL